MDGLRAHFDGLADKMVATLRSLVEFGSPSTDKTATDRIAGYVGHLASSAGATVTVVPETCWGNHVQARRGGEGRGIVILSHLDTVCPVVRGVRLTRTSQLPWECQPWTDLVQSAMARTASMSGRPYQVLRKGLPGGQPL